MKDITRAVAPQELVPRYGDQTQPVLWLCGKCQIPRNTAADALSCCAPNVCTRCGKEYTHYCVPCSLVNDALELTQKKDAAQVIAVEDYTEDFLVCPHCDEFFSSMDDLLDSHIGSGEEKLPTWAWGVTVTKLRLDADDVISTAKLSADEREGISEASIQDLQKRLDAWVDVHAFAIYSTDYSRCVVFPEEVVNAAEEA